MTITPHLFGALSSIFFFVACIVPDWSNGTVQVKQSNAFGEISIGLWQACADMTSENKVAIFSTLGDCRQGHCTLSDKLTGKGTSWSAENLCDKSAVVQAFLILAIFASFMSLFFTSWRSFAGRSILWGKGAFFDLLAALFSMIAWATWVDWNNTMNSNRPNPATESRPQTFSELDLGPGCTLAIIGWVLATINFFVLKNRFQLQWAVDAAKKAGRLSQNFDTQSTQQEPYLEVSGEPVMVANNRLPTYQEPPIKKKANPVVPKIGRPLPTARRPSLSTTTQSSL